MTVVCPPTRRGRIARGAFLLGVLLAAGPLSAEGWPEFRGPTGQGLAAESHLPLTWSKTEGVRWKAAIPGTGWSSPVVLGQQVWLTTASVESISASDDPRLAGPSSIPRTAANDLIMRAICVDLESGQITQDIELLREPRPDPIHSMNSYASPTPCIEPGRVYCHFGANGTACIDTQTGSVLWTQRDLKINHVTGAGSSPILWGDLMIVHCDGADEQFICALDKQTGSIAWKTTRSGHMGDSGDVRKSFGTPLLIGSPGQPLLVSPASNWLYAYDPLTGREVWRVSYGTLGFSVVPRPVTWGPMLYVCTGFMKAEMLALTLHPHDRHAAPTITWRYNKQVPQIASPVVVGNEIYFVSDQGGILTCLDAESGAVHYRERLGGTHAASLLYAGRAIYVANRQGQVHVVRPGAAFERLAVNELDSGILASPAVAGDRLLIRTEQSLYCLQQP